MKYCLFDGGDVVGPFTAKELLLRAGFGAHSLVCPEEHSDQENYWKEASFYEEFGFDPLPRAPAPQAADGAAQSERFLKEMDTVMTELSALNVGEKVPAAGLDEDEKIFSASAAEAAQEKPSVKKASENLRHCAPAPHSSAPDTGAAAVPAQAPAPADLPPAAQAPAQTKPASVPPAHTPPAQKPALGMPPANTPPAQKPALGAPQATARPEQKPASGAQPEGAERKISSILMQASAEMKKTEAPPAQHPPQAQAAAQQPPAAQPVQPAADAAPADKKEETAPVRPAVQPDPETEVVARTISKVSPIEEYFNTIKGGDLGNILGIPDAKENSDMNLTRALESQFEKTEPETDSAAAEEDPFDEFTPKEDPPQGDLFEPVPTEADRKTEEKLKRTLPDLKNAEALPLSGQPLIEPAQEVQDTQPPLYQEMIVPEQEDDPNDRTVKTILEGKLKVDMPRQEIPEPIKEVPAEERITRLQEEEDAQDEMLKERVVARRPVSAAKFVFLGLGVLLLLGGVYLNWAVPPQTPAAPAPQAAQAPAAAAPAPQAAPAPSARQAVNAAPAVPAPPADPLELAINIVQNHALNKGRGTVEEFLNKKYAKQLASGYGAMWSAEPLHRDAYVVKYRLAKTRKEPIVYIFQADTAKKKLTGALNNITLDLVGKIRP